MEASSAYPQLKKLFDGQQPLSDEEWGLYASKVVVREFAAQELITQPGKREEYISFIERGSVRMYALQEGKEICVTFRFQGEFVSSYASFLTGQPSRLYLEAMEDAVLYGMRHADLQQLYGLSKDGERLGRLNAEGLYIEQAMHLEALLMDPPYMRFQQLLKAKPVWFQRVPQKYLASYLNITPETFSRYKRKLME
ncbi:MAG TPA: CarD family transcriptional regulator [Cytophagales bacterium]|nr:CarD family transcriptional regulator [Cytophagales bacterium]HAP65127.1 CarD family transcriptional regulator [Cytophagales bacterium]